MSRLIALLFFVAALVAGCGGGGGVAPAESDQPPSEQPGDGGGKPDTETEPPPPVASDPCAASAAATAWTQAQILAAMRDRAAGATEYPLSTTPPVITPGIKNAGSQIASSMLIPWTDSRFFYTGNLVQAGTTYPDHMFGANRSVSYSSTSQQSTMLGIEFVTDAPSFEIFLKGTGSTTRMRVIVDGELANVSPVEYPVDGSGYLTKVDFTKRAYRKIRLDAPAPYFGGVRIGPDDTLCAAPASARFRTMFLGDSITEGPAGQGEHGSYAYYAAQRLGWGDSWISGVGATGYLAAPAPKLTFRQRFAFDVVRFAPQVLVISGGINDSGRADGEIQAEAAALFDEVQQSLPSTVVFVLGPWNPRSVVRPGVNEAIKTAAAGRPNFFWVPNYDDAWITGTGRVGAPKGDGNSDWVISSDGAHPSPEGIHYLAQRFAESVRQLIGAN